MEITVAENCIREFSLFWLCITGMIKADEVLYRIADGPGCFWMVVRWMGGSVTLFLTVPDTSKLSLCCCEAQIKPSLSFPPHHLSLHPAILNNCILIETFDAVYGILNLAWKVLCWLNYMWTERCANTEK